MDYEVQLREYLSKVYPTTKNKFLSLPEKTQKEVVKQITDHLSACARQQRYPGASNTVMFQAIEVVLAEERYPTQYIPRDEIIHDGRNYAVHYQSPIDWIKA